jgi:hypothetical protein
VTDRLESALRDLGARLDVPEPPDVTAAVRARLVAPAVRPRIGWRRWAAAVVIAFVTAFAVSPAVRAAVVDLLSFAGISFSQETPPPVGDAPLPGERTVDLATAQGLAEFEILVPVALGPPEEVRVSERVVSLVYQGARLDEFDGRIGQAFEKFVAMSGGSRVRVGAFDGIWIPGPHEVLYVDRSGAWRSETARLSAQTLIWQQGDVTFRLEGDFTVDQALEIAATVR